MKLIIRQAEPETDWLTGIWPILQEVVHAGDTLVFPPDTDEQSAGEYWLLPAPARVFVAVNETDGAIVGSSLVKANQPGLGGHVANAAFMVAASAAGRGVGRALAEHAIEWARQSNFSAMQFNFVVSTNSRAIVEGPRVFDRGDYPTSLSASGARPEGGRLRDAPLPLREDG